MKMNKIIIPVAALAMGVALVGSVSSTLAWYQYSTKAQAAFIGTSVGESENLEIKTADVVTNTTTPVWKTNLSSADVEKLAGVSDSTQLIPVTPNVAGSFAADDALPTSNLFHDSIETGVDGYRANHYATANNYIQFTLNIRYKKVQGQTSYVEKALKLVDLTIMENTDAASTAGDLYKAIRVHFSTADDNSLFARDSSSTAGNTVETQTYGPLDTDNDGQYDKKMVYEWDTGASTPVVYGVDGSSQVANNSTKVTSDNPFSIGTLPANESGLAVKVTIWIEGWQKLSGVPANNKDT